MKAACSYVSGNILFTIERFGGSLMNTILGKDKNQLLLFLYQGRTINRQAFDQYFFPNGTSQTEFIHEIVGPYDIVEYELRKVVR